MNARWIRSLAVLAGVLCLASSAHAELVLGVHPFKPATRLAASFTPLTQYLSARLGEPVRLHVARDYQAHLDGVAIGRYDFAYLGPSLYVQMRGLHGPRPLLARQQIGNSPVFHGKIVVRADSPIRRLADLAGKRFAFGDPLSTMGHRVPRYLLWQAGVGVEQLASHKFVGDHLNVALGVLAGEFDAGAVKEDVFYQYEKRGLRAIATSPPISDHLFVATHRMQPDKIRKLRALLLAMHRDAEGRAALQAMTPGVRALVPVQDSDYDSLRAIMQTQQALGMPM